MTTARRAICPIVALWIGFLTAAPVVCAEPTAIASRKPAAIREFLLDMPVSMDERVIGELTVVISGTALSAVDVTSWNTFGGKFFAPEAVKSIASAAVNDRIPVVAFASAGMQIRYDPARLLLLLVPQREQRAIESLSLLPGGGAVLSGSDMSNPVSAYINIRALRDFVTAGQGNAPNPPLNVSLDGAARLFGARGAALEWSAFPEGSEGNRWTRGDVRLIHDNVDRAIRFTAGDVYFQTAEFQGGVPLLGFSAERRYAVLQPNSAVAATSQRSFVLPRPSRITIYVNGAFQRSFQLAPGRYNISDFATADGANDVRIEVEDNTGQREVIEFTLFMDATLLRPGDSEFSVNVGYRRKADENTSISYDYDRPAWSGFVRYGLSEASTFGANFQGEKGLYVFGVEGVATSPLGNFFGAVNASRRDGTGSGRAGTGRWSYNIGNGSDRRLRRLDLSAIYTSRGYTSLGLDQPNNKFSWEFQSRLSTPLPFGMFGSISGRHARVRDAVENNENRIGLLLTKRFSNVSASLSVERITGLRNETFGSLTLSLPLGSRQGIQSNWQSRDNRSRVEWAQSPTQAIGSVSGSVGVETSDLGRSATADLTYNANRFIFRGRHDIAQAGLAEGLTTQRERLQLETAVAFVDGKLAVGRPISDSFAIISRHSSLKDTEIMVNPTSGPIAVADRFGPALLSSMTSYRTQAVTWDAMQLPAGYDLGDTQRLIVPALHSGFHFQVGSDASITAVGLAMRADGTPLPLVAGEIRADDGRDFRPSKTFTNRAGRFTAQALAPGAYILILATEPRQVLRFRIANSEANYVNLGNLQVTEK